MQVFRKLIPKILLLFGVICLISFSFFYSWREEKASSKALDQTQKELLSQRAGYEIWSKFKKFDDGYMLEEVIRGMRACEEGNACVSTELLNELESASLQERATSNLKKAEAYLAQVSKKLSVITCVPSFLYYEILNKGINDATLSDDSKAFFHYTMSTLDEEEIYTTYDEDEPREIHLVEAIEGFSKAVVGMKEKEKRRIYIHPSLAYRGTEWHVPPQSLIILDVELVGL